MRVTRPCDTRFTVGPASATVTPVSLLVKTSATRHYPAIPAPPAPGDLPCMSPVSLLVEVKKKREEVVVAGPYTPSLGCGTHTTRLTVTGPRSPGWSTLIHPRLVRCLHPSGSVGGEEGQLWAQPQERDGTKAPGEPSRVILLTLPRGFFPGCSRARKEEGTVNWIAPGRMAFNQA